MKAGNPDPSLIAPNPDAKIGLFYATGGLSDDEGFIRLVASTLKTKPVVSLEPGMDPLGLKRGFRQQGAEIHLVVRSHGDALSDDYTPQITNLLDPYCKDPLLGYEGAEFNGNVCTDVQAAVFAPGTDGEGELFYFADQAPVPNGKVQLFRRDDGLQAVIETYV